MPMLDARDIWRRYDCPSMVVDATGRELRNVAACNPETGEVIMYETRPFIRFLGGIKGNFYAIADGGQLATRHGFWPAPLTIRLLP